MPVIIVGDEKNFAALRPRLFRGRVSNKVVHEVTEAIASANPDADLKALQPGMVLTVPDDPRLSVEGDLSLDQATRQALDGIAQAVSQALGELSATGKRRERESVAEAKRLTKVLSGRELKAAIRKDKDLSEALQSARAGASAEAESAQERTAALEKAQAEWTKELDALKTLLP
jgi:hypothetical protein